MLKQLISPPVRASLRQAFADLPVAARDFRADLSDRLARDVLPVPPARLRRRVGRNGSRDAFLTIGRQCADDLLTALHAADHDPSTLRRWLDFGCGCGRISRHLLAPDRHITGVDVDAVQTRWAAKHLPGRWLAIDPQPPLPLPADSLDAAFSVSVFTHLDETGQFDWLEELRRVLGSGALLIASTHGPELTWTLPPEIQLTPKEVESAGFVHFSSVRGFNHQVTFHTREYLQANWTRFFKPVTFLPAGLDGYQDLSVWSV